jgi:hypothetical protein
MISRTQSGNPDEQPSSASIVGMLGGGVAIGVFALCCAERLSVVAERLAESPLVGKTVRTGLEFGWAICFGQHPGSEAISAAICDLDKFIGLDRNFGKFHRYLNDTVIAVAYALDAARENDSTSALNVADTAREIYFKLAQSIWPGLSPSAYATSPIMREETLRQVRDAQAIISWGDIIPPERLRALRKTAHGEGETLVELILGCKRHSEEDYTADQQSLF